MAKRKARSVWVWMDGRGKVNYFHGVSFTKPKGSLLFEQGRYKTGYVEFREVLPRVNPFIPTKKRKVKRGKK